MLDVKDQIKESERQLNDNEHHGHLEYDPTTENNATVNKVITRLKNDKLVSNNGPDGLKAQPQEHHASTCNQKYIKKETQVSSLNTHTSKISEYVDFHL